MAPSSMKPLLGEIRDGTQGPRRLDEIIVLLDKARLVFRYPKAIRENNTFLQKYTILQTISKVTLRKCSRVSKNLLPRDMLSRFLRRTRENPQTFNQK